ncbi:hypothetical protein IPU70_22415 [Achromobacter sp. SD115]|uniref:hypothetical protein n=1 Tax=Achromobacter sp. SD115 TaxID=2782011 RepID=UPI001A95DF73|nr:hypothetical protein [Achromobacter sp. SD115]MBO1016336.1 hypothetical protein [Achromobacter sp. SD115]
MALPPRFKIPLLALFFFLTLASGLTNASETPEKLDGFGLFCRIFPSKCGNPPPTRTDPDYQDISLVQGYRDCSYKDLGNGVGLFRVTFDLTGVPSGSFQTRAILVQLYDQAGNLQAPAHVADQVTLNGAPSSDLLSIAGFNLYSGERNGGSWVNASAHAARVEIRLRNQLLQSWPAIGVRTAALQRVGSPLLRDVKTVSISTTDDSGNCNTGDPTRPQLQDTKITMTAPNWDLGELEQGVSVPKRFPDASGQLCFTHDDQKSTGLRYAINATNQNGLSSNGSYQLKHLTSPADAVSYRLVLQNALTLTDVELPNTRNIVFALGNSGRECFTPTFTATTPQGAKEGDYADVLTFTVVARP